jgi:hypothetical protein
MDHRPFGIGIFPWVILFALSRKKIDKKDCQLVTIGASGMERQGFRMRLLENRSSRLAPYFFCKIFEIGRRGDPEFGFKNAFACLELLDGGIGFSIEMQDADQGAMSPFIEGVNLQVSLQERDSRPGISDLFAELNHSDDRSCNLFMDLLTSRGHPVFKIFAFRERKSFQKGALYLLQYGGYARKTTNTLVRAMGRAAF